MLVWTWFFCGSYKCEAGFHIVYQKLRQNWRIAHKFQDRHIYDVPEMQNYDVESDEMSSTNDDVYKMFQFNVVWLAMILMMCRVKYIEVMVIWLS